MKGILECFKRKKPKNGNVHHRIWNLGLNPIRDTPYGQAVVTVALMAADAAQIYNAFDIIFANWVLNGLMTFGTVMVIDYFMCSAGAKIPDNKFVGVMLTIVVFALGCFVVSSYVEVRNSDAAVETVEALDVPDKDIDPEAFNEYEKQLEDAYGTANKAYAHHTAIIPIATTIGLFYFGYSGKKGRKLYDDMQTYYELEDQEYDIQKRIYELENMPALEDLLQTNDEEARAAETLWLDDLADFIDEQKLEIATNVATDFSATDFFFNSKKSRIVQDIVKISKQGRQCHEKHY